MNKNVLLSLILVLITGAILAQPANPPAPRTGPVFVETEEIVIELKSMIPPTGIYQAKADTYIPSGQYSFALDDEFIREHSELLLNKWLKESK
ncbi:MAG TPA: hypothetical protein PL188_10225 [Candidatus Cloacimonadota bacterium]|nr:hypothetical protein [Candidatus Cloacimonadota bacterium]